MNKKSSFKASLAAVLAALIAATALMAGCGSQADSSEDKTANETRVVTETQVVTKIVDGVYTDENGNVIKDKNGQPVTAVQTGTDADGNPVYGNESAENNGSASGSGNSGSNSSAAGGSESKSSDSKSNGGSGNSGNSGGSGNSGSSDKSSGSSSSKSGGGSGSKGGSGSTLSIGGKTYNVGDKVTCTYQLTCKKLFVNFQALINYDGSCLKATNAYFEGQATSGSVLNYDLDSQIKFNGIKLSGYNYTNGGNFFVVEYEVIGGGSTSPEFVWQIATDNKDNALVKNGVADSSLQLTESYS